MSNEFFSFFYAAIILSANGPTDGFPEFSNRYIQQHSGKSQFPTVFSHYNVNIDFSFSAMKYLWTDQTFLSATGVVATMHQELKMAPGGGGKMGIS